MEHAHIWKRRASVYIDGSPLYVCECGAKAVDDDEKPILKKLIDIAPKPPKGGK